MRHDFIEVGPMLLDAFKHAKNPNSKVYAFNLETMRTRTDYNSEIQNLNSEELAPCVEHLLFRKVPKSDQLLKNFMADSIANFVIRGYVLMRIFKKIYFKNTRLLIKLIITDS